MPLGVAYSDKTIKVEIDGNGIVHMDIPTGDANISMAFPINQLIKNIGVCQRAIAKWDKSPKNANIVPFRRNVRAAH